MQALTPTKKTAVSGQVTTKAKQQQQLAENLPGWLRDLIGAYPQQRPNALTFAVLEDQFADVDDAMMSQAVRVHVKGSKFWPAAEELWQAVEAVAPHPVALVGLIAMRQELTSRPHEFRNWLF